MVRTLTSAVLLCAAALVAAPPSSDKTPQKNAAGRESFRIACARCHGPAGDADNYPGIKKLSGIGTRLSKSAIRDRLHPLPLGKEQFSVRSHVFSAEQLDALVSYLATL